MGQFAIVGHPTNDRVRPQVTEDLASFLGSNGVTVVSGLCTVEWIPQLTVPR